MPSHPMPHHTASSHPPCKNSSAHFIFLWLLFQKKTCNGDVLFLFANPPPTPPANFLKMDSSIHKKWNSPHTTLVTSCSYIHGRSHICAIKRRHHAIAAEENRLDRIEGTLINKMQPSMVQVVSTWKSFCVSGPLSEVSSLSLSNCHFDRDPFT